MTLAEIAARLNARGMVGFSLWNSPRGIQVSTRSEGGGWVSETDRDAETAVGRLLDRLDRPDAATERTRYFVSATGDRIFFTTNGQPPLEQEGPVEEVSAREWAEHKARIERRHDPAPDYGDFV